MFVFLVGSICSMLNENDHMASTTTLQSHLPPAILESSDSDENQDEIEGEQISLTG